MCYVEKCFFYQVNKFLHLLNGFEKAANACLFLPPWLPFHPLSVCFFCPLACTLCSQLPVFSCPLGCLFIPLLPVFYAPLPVLYAAPCPSFLAPFTEKITGRKLNCCLKFLSYSQFFPSVWYKIYARHHCRLFKSYR